MEIYQPQPRLSFSEKERKKLLEELRALGFGREKRTPEHAGAYPALDELTYHLEEQEKK